MILRHTYLAIFFAALLIHISIFSTKAEIPNLKITSVSNQLKLYQNNISDIFQDNNGFLWYGGHPDLIKYYGTGYNRYLNDERIQSSISSFRVSKIFQDSNNRIWVGTLFNGLNVLDQNHQNFDRFLAGITVHDITKKIIMNYTLALIKVCLLLISILIK